VAKEAQEALEALKKFLTTPPVLKPPCRATPGQPAEDLLLYISCTTHVVSTEIVVERVEEGHAYPVQHPVYFIREVLGPSKVSSSPKDVVRDTSNRSQASTLLLTTKS
jgi:hypothetical protein